MASDHGEPGNSGLPVLYDPLSAEAVRALYEVHGQDLLAFLVGVLRDLHAAQDACQATFQRLLESGHEVRQQTIRGWLFTVAYHEAMAVRRQQMRDQKLQAERNSVAEVTSEFDFALQTLVRSEEVERLKSVIRELPDEQQLVVRKRIENDMTFSAIAAELNVPLGTVLTRMRLAFQKLQQRLGRD